MLTAIIQARLNSNRLPRKVLLPFNGKTVLQETIRQVKKSIVDQVILATPFETFTDLNICYDNWYRWGGDENDLVSRYYHAACKYHADPIVRICSDCPLILPEVIDLVIEEYFLKAAEYAFNRCDDSPGSWPDGLDVEVFSFAVLQRAYVLAKKREHMTFIRNTSLVYQVKLDKDYGPCTSINTEADYQKALQILRERQNGHTSQR